VSAEKNCSLKCANGSAIFEINYPRHASKFAIKIVLSTLQTGLMRECASKNLRIYSRTQWMLWLAKSRGLYKSMKKDSSVMRL